MPTMKSSAVPAQAARAPASAPSCAAAAAIAGTPSRNENRAAASRRRPRNRAERERRARARHAGHERRRLREADAQTLRRSRDPRPAVFAVPTRSATSSSTPPSASVMPTTAGVRSWSSTVPQQKPHDRRPGSCRRRSAMPARAGASCARESTRGQRAIMRTRSCRKYTSTASSVPR